MSDDTSAPEPADSDESHTVLTALENEIVELRGIVEAVAVLAREVDERAAQAAMHDRASAAGEAPCEGLIWAVRALQARVAALDARIAGA